MAEICAPASAVKHINDITECPICNEIFTDPRVMPCVHTFCFECISKWAEDQARGGVLACPLCRKELGISGYVTVSGKQQVANLPKNSFVQKMVNVRKLSSTLSGTDIFCDVCCEASDNGQVVITGEVQKAVAYCVKCSQNLCKQCCLYHWKMKFSREHKIVELHENQSTQSELLLELPENKCDKHGDEMLKLYCHDCKMPTCSLCLATDHQRHKLSDVKPFADELRIQMNADIADINAKVNECRQLLTKLDNDAHPNFSREIDLTAKLVIETAEKIKQAVDDYTAKLLDELESVRMQQVKKVESVHQELEAAIQMLEIFKHYSEQMESKGRACDIAASAPSLHTRATELIRHKVCKGFPDKCLMDIKFSSAFSIDQLQCLFGELSIESELAAHSTAVSDSSLLSSIELLGLPGKVGRDNVTGITSLGDDIFVVHQSARSIEVYDAGTLELKRSLSLRQLKASQSSLAACSRNQCVYLSNRSLGLIHRIDPVTSDRTAFWSTASGPTGVAVNRNANLLVTCCEVHKIQEFTTDGTLVREIVLQSDVTFPMCAVQLADDQFGVVHSGSLHRFCVIGSDGRVIRSYGGQPGSGSGQFMLPAGISSNECGDRVFIADKENKRILMLDPLTMSVAELALNVGLVHKTGVRLRYPFCVHYDQSRQRLYIGEHGRFCRVIVVTVKE